MASYDEAYPGLPPNLAAIARRNLARVDASIAKLNAARGKIAGTSPDEIAAIGERYGGGVNRKGILEGKAAGYYDAKGKFLGGPGGTMPAGTVGIVGAAPRAPFDPVTARATGYYGDPRAILAKPAAQRTPFEKSYLTGYAGNREDVGVAGGQGPASAEDIALSGLGRIASRGAFVLPGLFGGALGAAQTFFPAIRSFFNSSRPRPYNPVPALRNVTVPTPTPSPSPSNPYYADNEVDAIR